MSQRITRRRYTVAPPALVALAALSAIAPKTSIADTLWQASPLSSATWFDPANWTAGLPTSAVIAQFNNGGTADIATQSAAASSLILGNAVGESGNVTLASGSLTVSGVENVGKAGSATFTQNGGTHTINSGSLQIAGTGSVYSLSNGSLIVNGTSFVGRSLGSAGTLNQSGGSHTASALFLGANGTYNLSGGTLAVTSGVFNEGTINVSGTTTMQVSGLADLGIATFQNPGTFNLAVTGSNALLILPAGTNTASFASFSNPSGTTIYAGSGINIAAGATLAAGSGGTREFVTCSGTITGTSLLYGGINVQNAAANASISGLRVDGSQSGISAGQLTVSTPQIGYSGTGTFEQTGGTVTISGSGYLGYNAGASGTYKLSGGTLKPGVGYIYVGYGGTGTFEQTGGTLTANFGGTSLVSIGEAGATGSYMLSNGQLSSTLVRVGNGGTGTFTQSGGTHSSGSIYVSAGNGTGTYTLSAGNLTETSQLFVGYQGTGHFVQSNGTHNAAGLGIAYNAGSTGTYDLSGGTFTVSSAQIGGSPAGSGGSGTLRVNGGTGTFTGSARIWNNNSSLEVTAGSLTVSFLTVVAGTLSHTGGAFTANSITSTGRMNLDAPATVTVITLNGGTLSGHGTLTGRIAAGSGSHTIAPSFDLAPTATGTFTMKQLTTSANTVIALNLVNAGMTPANDMLNVTGAGLLALGGGTIQVANTPSTAESLGYYKIIGYSGAIQGAGISSLTAPAAQGDVTYFLTTSHDPGFVDLHKGLLGDADDSGTVTFTDFVALSNHFGQSGAGWEGADFNRDGVTDFSDFVTLSNHFGQTITGGNLTVSSNEFAALQAFGAAAAVPEPLTAGLLVAGLSALLLRKKRR